LLTRYAQNYIFNNTPLYIVSYHNNIIAINKQLGNVVDSAPTEEMFEEEVVIETTLENKDGGWEGSSSW
jgi:hypothetical protein